MKIMLEGNPPPAGLRIAVVDDTNIIQAIAVVELDEHNKSYLELDSIPKSGYRIAALDGR